MCPWTASALFTPRPRAPPINTRTCTSCPWCDAQIVIQCLVPDAKLPAGGLGPFETANGTKRCIHGKSLGHPEIAIQRVLFSSEGVDVPRDGALCRRFEEYISVAGIQAFDSRSFVTGGK